MSLEFITPEVAYIVLVFGLFVVPKIFQRFRIPGAITSFALGVALSLGAHLFAHDSTVQLFATLGIVSLFLFAGLEVDFEELQREIPVLAQHLGIQLFALALVAFFVWRFLGVGTQAAVLIALALVTPSTGFILDSLPGFGLSEREQFWVKSKAISTELVALAVLFVVLQGSSASLLGMSILALGGLVVLVPIAFRMFAVWVRPFAPKSEFAFLIIVALVCAFVTRRLGVYYLVGAFLVGVAARRFRRDLPAIASEKMLSAVELFASFFVPFYFFQAGSHLQAEDISRNALLGGLAVLLVLVPFRILTIAEHRRVALRETWRAALRVSTPLLPTLVFSLVIVEILRERFALPSWTIGALVTYTILNTIIPGLFLRVPPVEPDLMHFVGDNDPDVAVIPIDRGRIKHP